MTRPIQIQDYVKIAQGRFSRIFQIDKITSKRIDIHAVDDPSNISYLEATSDGWKVPLPQKYTLIFISREEFVLHPSLKPSPSDEMNLTSVVRNEQDLIQRGVLGVIKQQLRSSEDHYLVSELNNDIQMYAVFDGHGGDQGAQILEDKFDQKISETLAGLDFADQKLVSSRLQEAMDSFEREHFLNLSSGSTMVMALFKNNILYFVNLGDSRAILFDSNRQIHMVTQDHTPQSEITRITDVGGVVYQGRVNAILAVSRSFGDVHLKNVKREYSPRGPVSLQADFYAARNFTQHMYILLASDGLFESPSGREPSNQEIVNEIASGTNIMDGCQRLVSLARRNGATDDVTVMIAQLS